MFVDFMTERFAQSQQNDAVVWRDQIFSYQKILRFYQGCRDFLQKQSVVPFSVVSLEADFSPLSIGFLLALIEQGSTIVPLTTSVEAKKPEFREIAEVEYVLKVGDKIGACEIVATGRRATHPILTRVREMGHPALILFSSGSTGKSKAAVHDFLPLLDKFKTPRKSKRMISFLLFDHIGGINTLLYVLSNAGTLVTVEGRAPETIVSAIEKYRVEALPTSPTFLNLLLMSEAHRGRNLSSLELITYGTEPMPESTLSRLRAAFPDVQLQQTYGLSELGILRSKSKSADSLWVKIGGEGFETRVREGLLEIKAKSAMLGYLNAPSPFTEDGWFKTGDLVEVDGEYFRILGRKSDLINVGGEKVYPAEIENALLQMPGVEQAVVTAETNLITGNLVKATVRLNRAETVDEFRKRMRESLREQGLANFKIPQKVVLADKDLHTERFKQARQV